MAKTAKFTIRVRSTRGGVSVAYSTTGAYISLPVNTVQNPQLSGPVQTGQTAVAFWGSIFDLVEQDFTGHT